VDSGADNEIAQLISAARHATRTCSVRRIARPSYMKRRRNADCRYAILRPTMGLKLHDREYAGPGQRPIDRDLFGRA